MARKNAEQATEGDMGSFWNSPQGMKNLALALLALALTTIAAMHIASQKMIAIQGPGTLQVIDGQHVWLGVNDDLWLLDGQGRKTGQRTLAQLGLTEAVSNIVLAPDGQALVTSRGDLGWQVVNVGDLSRVRTITPQWPADFRDNYLRAIHIAISPNWDIAVGTGGGHAVLLFDRDGKFRARTAPGTFYFTNGLWHGPEGWWTTDTNRSTLRLLDTETLAAKRSIPLTGALGAYAALGELVASRGEPVPGSEAAPVATVSRLGFLMEPGYAVDVFADGSHVPFNKEPLARLRDMAWLGQNLLVVDGGEYQVLRFDANRTALPPFGDGDVNRALQQMRSDREFWSNLSSRYMFLVAALLLLAGIAAFRRHKKLAVRAVISARPGGARPSSPVGTLRQSRWKLVRQRLWIFALPMALRLAAAIGGMVWLLPWLVGDPIRAAANRPLLLLNAAWLSILGPVFLVALWQHWRHLRLAAKPRYESTLNHKALLWLDRHDDWDQVSQPGEVPRETVYLPGWKARWLLVTNQRVLLFAASARERRLQREWPRRSIVFAGRPQDAPGGRQPWLVRRLLLRLPNLALVFDGGERLVLRCASAVTADRAARLLMQARPPQAQLRPSGRRKVRRRWHEVAASFLVPGTGQLLQDRFVTGTVLLTAGILLCLLGWGPVVWASNGPKMHVGLFEKAYVALLWLALVLAAAADAFHFSATRRGKR